MNKVASHEDNALRSCAQRELIEELHALTLHLKKTNSIRHRLVMGVFWGIGGVLGATIIAAPLVFVLSKLLAPLGLDVSS